MEKELFSDIKLINERHFAQVVYDSLQNCTTIYPHEWAMMEAAKQKYEALKQLNRASWLKAQNDVVELEKKLAEAKLILNHEAENLRREDKKASDNYSHEVARIYKQIQEQGQPELVEVVNAIIEKMKNENMILNADRDNVTRAYQKTKQVSQLRVEVERLSGENEELSEMVLKLKQQVAKLKRDNLIR